MGKDQVRDVERLIWDVTSRASAEMVAWTEDAISLEISPLAQELQDLVKTQYAAEELLNQLSDRVYYLFCLDR